MPGRRTFSSMNASRSASPSGRASHCSFRSSVSSAFCSAFCLSRLCAWGLVVEEAALLHISSSSVLCSAFYLRHVCVSVDRGVGARHATHPKQAN